jgi:hypothetical protein
VLRRKGIFTTALLAIRAGGLLMGAAYLHVGWMIGTLVAPFALVPVKMLRNRAQRKAAAPTVE